MPTAGHIAIDLGAESGRVVLGAIGTDGRLWSEQVHRFTHRPVPTPAGLCWDFTGLWLAILDGLRRIDSVARMNDIAPASVGVDTWAVDWSLVSPTDTLLGLPRCYRDAAFPVAFERVTREVGASTIYEATGIQHLPFNTLYQLAAEREREPMRFDSGRLMFVPDLLHWMLSGRQTCERTNASTSQLLDTRTGMWSDALLDRARLQRRMLIDPIDAGTTIGPIRADVAAATGLSPELLVIAPPTHDTAAAVAAVPAERGTRWAYLSSGTWSLLGAEIDSPCINAASERANFTNELGLGGTVRFLKNIAGLWLVQECRREWERDGALYDYTQLTQLAADATPFRTLIAANDSRFLAPRSMLEAIRSFAAATGQPIPSTPGEFVRCCLESLALEYRRTLDSLSETLGRSFDVLHIVGGGSRNALLNRFTADATRCRVHVGPAEGTALGNLLTQAMGLGLVRDRWEIRDIVRRTEPPVVIEPESSAAWDVATERYARLR